MGVIGLLGGGGGGGGVVATCTQGEHAGPAQAVAATQATLTPTAATHGRDSAATASTSVPSRGPGECARVAVGVTAAAVLGATDAEGGVVVVALQAAGVVPVHDAAGGPVIV